MSELEVVKAVVAIMKTVRPSVGLAKEWTMLGRGL